MKTIRYALSGLAILAAVVGVRAADAADTSRTRVVFSDPEKFADAADGPRGSDLRRESNLEQLRSYLVQRAPMYIPEGQTLMVTITDVDLAGEVEPWRTRAQDVRIVRSSYTPKIDLTFKLTDASGNVVKEGKRHLSDLTFDMNLNREPSDPRVYEKRLLSDWLQNEFRKSKR